MINFVEIGYEEEDNFVIEEFEQVINDVIADYEKSYKTEVVAILVGGRVGTWQGKTEGGKIINPPFMISDVYSNVDAITIQADVDTKEIYLLGHHHDNTHEMQIELLTQNKVERLFPSYHLEGNDAGSYEEIVKALNSKRSFIKYNKRFVDTYGKIDFKKAQQSKEKEREVAVEKQEEAKTNERKYNPVIIPFEELPEIKQVTPLNYTRFQNGIPGITKGEKAIHMVTLSSSYYGFKLTTSFESADGPFDMTLIFNYGPDDYEEGIFNWYSQDANTFARIPNTESPDFGTCFKLTKMVVENRLNAEKLKRVKKTIFDAFERYGIGPSPKDVNQASKVITEDDYPLITKLIGHVSRVDLFRSNQAAKNNEGN